MNSIAFHLLKRTCTAVCCFLGGGWGGHQTGFFHGPTPLTCYPSNMLDEIGCFRSVTMSEHGVRSPAPAWVVSIDFGTRGSGFAIRRASAPAGTPPALHESWPDQPESRYPKDLTAILYRGR
jgi:hypothetical protein